MTPSKKCVSILFWNFSFVEIYSLCLSVLKLAPAEYATNAFSSKWKNEKLAVVVHVLRTTQNLVISRCCSEEDGKEMYKVLKRTCTARLFCSFIIFLFRDVLVAVAVVFCVRSLLNQTHGNMESICFI